MTKEECLKVAVTYQKELIAEIPKLRNKEIAEIYTFLAPSQIFTTFEEYFDFKETRDRDDFDSNGWQYDYWIPFTLEDVKYQISGSGYYGTTTITTRDEEE